MTEVKLLEFIPTTDVEKQTSCVGFAHVELNGRMHSLVKVCKGKNGVFGSFINANVNGVWRPSWGLGDKEKEKEIIDKTLNLVAAIVNKASISQPQYQQPAQHELPF